MQNGLLVQSTACGCRDNWILSIPNFGICWVIIHMYKSLHLGYHSDSNGATRTFSPRGSQCDKTQEFKQFKILHSTPTQKDKENYVNSLAKYAQKEHDDK